MTNVLVIANYELDRRLQENFGNCAQECNLKTSYHFNDGFGSYDLVCVLNEPKRLHLTKAPRNRLIKVVQEPNVEGSPFHGFVTKHAKRFALVIGHAGIRGQVDSRTNYKISHPHLFPQVLPGPAISKTKLVSIIASTLNDLPGHKKRNLFVSQILTSFPELVPNSFGRGRIQIDSKEEGLDEFMYSLAVENSVEEGYFTEKIIDCFLRDTVPIYYGAPDIEKFFPEKSVIRLPSLEPEEFAKIMSELSPRDYFERRQYVREAKQIYLESMQLCCQISKSIELLPAKKSTYFLFLPSFLNAGLALLGRVGNSASHQTLSSVFMLLRRAVNGGKRER